MPIRAFRCGSPSPLPSVGASLDFGAMVDDLGERGVRQAPAATVCGQVFNVGSADNWQLADVARLVAEICGPGVSVDITAAHGDLRDYRISTGKLAAATGWMAALTLRGGIGELAGALSAGVLDGHPALADRRAA